MDQKLVGQKITELFISEDAETLVFQTVGGIFPYQTREDCCNTVWFNHMDNVEALIGGTVIEVEEADWDGWQEIDSEDEWEVLEVAFWTIKTDKGHCKIEVRNSHNGYYGGEVVFVDWSIQDIELKALTDDF